MGPIECFMEDIHRSQCVAAFLLLPPASVAANRGGAQRPKLWRRQEEVPIGTRHLNSQLKNFETSLLAKPEQPPHSSALTVHPLPRIQLFSSPFVVVTTPTTAFSSRFSFRADPGNLVSHSNQTTNKPSLSGCDCNETSTSRSTQSSMAASDIQNPPAAAESKSARKKKAKTERTESPAPAAATSEKASSVIAADTRDDSSDNSYIRDLKK